MNQKQPGSSDELNPVSNLEEWRKIVRGYENRGMMIQAYDAATRALRQYPDDVWLRHREVLALVRSGAIETARKRYLERGLDKVDDEDCAALEARIGKNLALNMAGEARIKQAAVAAGLYRKVYNRTKGYFPGINCATLLVLSGNPDEARSLARRIIEEIQELGKPGTDEKAYEEAYYRAATIAEARLILNEIEGAKSALKQGIAVYRDDFAAWAATRRQLRLLCQLLSLDTQVLDVLSTKRVIHYLGHWGIPDEADLMQRIQDQLDKSDVGFGYGSLTCGAEILFAEALLEHGAELNVVLPFDIDEFIETSVRIGGPGWEDRFWNCYNQATTVNFATKDSYLGDDQLFTFANRLAMGLAVLRARHLDTRVEQIIIEESEKPVSIHARVAADAECWRKCGLPQSAIIVSGVNVKDVLVPSQPDQPVPRIGRVNRAILFGDFKGYSKLNDRQLPVFIDRVLGSVATVLERYRDSLCFRNTWGDGIYLVFDNVCSAAGFALDLQEEMRRLPLREFGLSEDIALRLSGHFGPVYEGMDPILGKSNIFGAHISRAARIEPITPEGCVYVTENFMASLILEPNVQYDCEYVGPVPTAKGYGEYPLYLLRHSVSSVSSRAD